MVTSTDEEGGNKQEHTEVNAFRASMNDLYKVNTQPQMNLPEYLTINLSMHTSTRVINSNRRYFIPMCAVIINQ